MYNENNTISLFIFRSNVKGMQYGMGTYIDELTKALMRFPEIKIYIVSYKNSENKELSVIKKSESIFEIIIPKLVLATEIDDIYNKKYANSVVRFISELITENEKVIFQFNCLDDLPVISRLRELYDFPIISIVHSAMWQQLFGGNKNKLYACNIDKPSGDIEVYLSRERDMYRQSDHIVSVTRYMKDFLIDEYGINPDKISVIKNGLNQKNNEQVSEKETTEIRKRFGFGENEIILLFSGRIDTCKGINYLMEAFEQACIKNNSLRLVMLGQGSIQDCQKRIQSCFGKVTYTGFLPRETVTEFYKIADIGIVPSVYDHCPYSVLEMMANGIPLIMTRINGLDELLSDEECVFINPVISSEGDISFSIEEITGSILSLAADKERRTRLAAKSYETYMKRFTAAGMAESMHKLFYSLLKQRKPVAENETSQGR